MFIKQIWTHCRTRPAQSCSDSTSRQKKLEKNVVIICPKNIDQKALIKLKKNYFSQCLTGRNLQLQGAVMSNTNKMCKIDSPRAGAKRYDIGIRIEFLSGF